MGTSCAIHDARAGEKIYRRGRRIAPTRDHNQTSTASGSPSHLTLPRAKPLIHEPSFQPSRGRLAARRRGVSRWPRRRDRRRRRAHQLAGVAGGRAAAGERDRHQQGAGDLWRGLVVRVVLAARRDRSPARAARLRGRIRRLVHRRARADGDAPRTAAPGGDRAAHRRDGGDARRPATDGASPRAWLRRGRAPAARSRSRRSRSCSGPTTASSGRAPARC